MESAKVRTYIKKVLLRPVIEQNPVGKIPVRKSKMRWEVTVRKHMGALERGTNWKMFALNRDD